MKNKVALVGGIAVIAIICAFVFLSGGGGGSSSLSAASPLTPAAITPSEKLQASIKDKKGMILLDALITYTKETPDDAVAWLMLGDSYKALNDNRAYLGDRYLAANAYWKGMQLGNKEARKRLLWMISPVSLMEGYIIEFDTDNQLISYNSYPYGHPSYAHESNQYGGMMFDHARAVENGTATEEDKKEAAKATTWFNIVDVLFRGPQAGPEKYLMFYNLLLSEENPSDEDYLYGAYVTIFSYYLNGFPEKDTLEEITVTPEGYVAFTLNDPKVKKIVEDEIKRKTPVGLTMKVMLESYQKGVDNARLNIEDALRHIKTGEKNVNLENFGVHPDTLQWIKTAQDRVKILEPISDNLDTIGKFVLGVEYLNMNLDENLNINGKYSQKAIDCFKACQKDPYAINNFPNTYMAAEIIPFPETEINKIVESIKTKGCYIPTGQNWGPIIEKMENVKWEDISPMLTRKNGTASEYPTRIILCSGTHNGDNISIIFPVMYSTTYDEWNIIQNPESFIEYVRVRINKGYEDLLPMYSEVMENTCWTILRGLTRRENNIAAELNTINSQMEKFFDRFSK